MSTLTVTTIQTANGSTDLTLQTGNTSAAKIVIPASGSGINLTTNVTVSGQLNSNTLTLVSPIDGVLNISGATSQYPYQIYVAPTTHATSRRTAILLDGWNFGQDQNGDGTKNFYFYDTTAAAVRARIDTNGSFNVVSNTLNLGTSSIAANGYSRLPNGLLFQWGTSAAIGQDSSGSVTFPIAFTTLFCITITPRAPTNTGGGGADNITANSTTGFTISHGADGTANFCWMAIGV